MLRGRTTHKPGRSTVPQPSATSSTPTPNPPPRGSGIRLVGSARSNARVPGPDRTPCGVCTCTRVPLPYRARRTVEYWRNETLLPALIGSQRRRTALEARALRHLHAQIPDPVLRRPTTILTTSPIAELAADAVHTADGRRHEIDELVHATGFHVSAALMRMPVHGRNGISLQEIWARDGASAHLGTTVAGIPNAFVLGGPNTGVGHTSVLFMLESQFRYVAAALDETDRIGADALVVREQAQHRFTTRIHRDSAATTRTRGGCRSWYLDREGINRSLWPGPTWRYRLHTRTFDLHNYTSIRASAGGQRRRRSSRARSPKDRNIDGDHLRPRRRGPVCLVDQSRARGRARHHQCRTITENMPTGRICSKIT